MGVLLVVLSIAHEYTDFSKFFKYLPNFYPHSLHWQFSHSLQPRSMKSHQPAAMSSPAQYPQTFTGVPKNTQPLIMKKSTCRPAASASFKPLLPPKRQWTRLGLNQRPPDYESGATNRLSGLLLD